MFNLTRPTPHSPWPHSHQKRIYLHRIVQPRPKRTSTSLLRITMFVCVVCTCLMRLYVLQCQEPACLQAILFALYIRKHTYTWLNTSIWLCIMHWYYQNRLQRQTRKYAIICMVTTVNQVCSSPESDSECTKRSFLNMLLCKLYMHDSVSTWICMRWHEPAFGAPVL